MKLAKLLALRPDQLFAQETFLVLNFITDGADPRAIVRPERFSPRKIPMQPSAIKLATFRHHRVKIYSDLFITTILRIQDDVT
jgi:hypothetical protein